MKVCGIVVVIAQAVNSELGISCCLTLSTRGRQATAQLQLSLQCKTDAAASAAATVKSILRAGLCGICISLGVSGVTDTLMPK